MATSSFGRATMWMPAAALVLVLLSCAAMGIPAAMDRMAMEPEMVFQSDAGTCEHWRADRQEMMRDTCMEGARLTLRERGLLLPKYSDSSLLIYCTRGRAMMGMTLPMGMPRNYRMIEKGQVVAVPKGLIFWFYNMGSTREQQSGEDCEMVMFADTSMEANPGQWTGFSLAGAKKAKMGGIMHGFSKDMLADAWDVEEDMVEAMVQGQKGTAMIRVSENHPFHKLMYREASRRGMRMRMRTDDDEEEQQQPEMNGDNPAAMSMMHFMYDMERATCDHYNNRGGCMTVLNRFRLPVLKWMRPHSGMGAARIRLEPDAMIAPGYMGNGHQMVYCTKGSVRVQVVKPNGDRWCDEEMKEGDMMMIPMGYPAMKKAGRDGCHLVSFITSDMPMAMFMAGRDSVLAGMPQELVMAAFNVDEGVASHMMQRRGRHSAILSPGRREGELDDSVDAGADSFHIEMMDAFLKSLKN